jgi:hypothetical protein
MVRVPAGVDAATVMELLAVRDRTPEELPAEPVGVAVLCLGDAAVGCGRPGEQPAGAEFRMGRSEDREVNQAFQLGATPLGPPWILAQLGHGGECMTRPGHSGGAYPQPVTKEKAERWTSWRAFAQVRHGSNIELLPFSLVPVTDTSYLSSCSFAYCLGSRHGLSSVFCRRRRGRRFRGPGADPVGDLLPALVEHEVVADPWDSSPGWAIGAPCARTGVGGAAEPASVDLDGPWRREASCDGSRAAEWGGGRIPRRPRALSAGADSIRLRGQREP